MNKVFNINLSGHLIAIEEPAYEDLQQYMQQLKLAFKHLDEKEEIIEDISARIAELFLKKLKSDKIAIQEIDVYEIKNIIGLPEDIMEESDLIMDNTQQNSNTDSYNKEEKQNEKNKKKKKLYRSKNGKIIAGVAGGIAEYFNIDPVLIRLLFFLSLTLLHGLAVLAYIILWIITPITEKQEIHISKRLYRDPNQKIIAGVCAGLGHYFKIETKWIRLIAILPFLLLMIPLYNFGSWTSYGSISWLFSFPSFFLIYIILWIAIPYPKNKIENAEMLEDFKDYDKYIEKVQSVHQEEAYKEELINTKKKKNKNGLWIFLGVLILIGVPFLFFYTFQFAFLPNTWFNFESSNSMIKISGLEELNESSFSISIIIFLIALFFISLIPIYFIIYLIFRIFNTNYKTNKTLKTINILLIILFILSILALIFSTIYWISY